jgi:Na+/proline symporter
MVVAAVALAWAGLAAAGGPGAAVHTLAELRPELLAPWSGAGATTSLGLFLLFALGPCAQPHYLQKFLVLRDARALRWLPLVMTGALLAILTVWLGLGLGGTALWLRGELTVDRPDQLAPRLVAHLARPGLRWLTVAAVLAAVMSTAATLLNLVAAALTRDLPRAVGRALPPSLTSARLATVATAALAAALALTAERPVALLGILGWGTFTAALLPVMVVGLAWPGAKRRGAVAALVVGPLVQLGLEALRLVGQPLGAVEPGLTGAAVGCVALVAGSLARSGSRPSA